MLSHHPAHPSVIAVRNPTVYAAADESTFWDLESLAKKGGGSILSVLGQDVTTIHSFENDNTSL
jgi:hypothetical protein